MYSFDVETFTTEHKALSYGTGGYYVVNSLKQAKARIRAKLKGMLSRGYFEGAAYFTVKVVEKFTGVAENYTLTIKEIA